MPYNLSESLDAIKPPESRLWPFVHAIPNPKPRRTALWLYAEDIFGWLTPPSNHNLYTPAASPPST